MNNSTIGTVNMTGYIFYYYSVSFPASDEIAWANKQFDTTFAIDPNTLWQELIVTRWFYDHGAFWFKNEADRLLFMMRWC